MTTTKDWGPKLWYSLHIITFNYPDTPTIIDKHIRIIRTHDNDDQDTEDRAPCDGVS